MAGARRGPSRSFNPLRFGAPPPRESDCDEHRHYPGVSIPFASGHLRHLNKSSPSKGERSGFNPLRFGAPPPQREWGGHMCSCHGFNPLRFGAPPPHTTDAETWPQEGMVSIPFASGHLRHIRSGITSPTWLTTFQSPSLRGTSATLSSGTSRGASSPGFNPLRFGAPPPHCVDHRAPRQPERFQSPSLRGTSATFW